MKMVGMVYSFGLAKTPYLHYQLISTYQTTSDRMLWDTCGSNFHPSLLYLDQQTPEFLFHEIIRVKVCYLHKRLIRENRKQIGLKLSNDAFDTDEIHF